MRRFLVAGRIRGRGAALRLLEDAVRRWRPDAVLFVGDVLTPASRRERSREEAEFLERFFQTAGRLPARTVVIPGPSDAPLGTFLRLGMNAEVEYPGIRLAHASFLAEGDGAVAGIGGELTPSEDAGAPVVRQSHTTAEYFLRPLWNSKPSLKVLLPAVPPTGRLGGPEGSPIVSELLHTGIPHLCAVGGPQEARGFERVARTTVVNPGELAEGSAAWVDLNRPAGERVRILDL
jgi:hypothetical protein